MPKYLGQAVAIEKDYREKGKRALTEAHHIAQNVGLLTGQERDYTPLVETDNAAEQLPSVRERVQFTAAELIDSFRDQLASMFDATASKDFTNANGARANVSIGDLVLVENAPVPYLLWLEKQLVDLETFIQKLPTHDPSTEWELSDGERGIYRSAPVETMRQVQEPRSKVIVPAGNHPAQVATWTENVPVGKWTTRRLTGSVPVAERAHMLRRVQALQRAVDVAREEANRTEADMPVIGARLVAFIFG